jgi:ureidoglycolate lyase
MHEQSRVASDLAVRRVELEVHPLESATFAPFGQVIAPTPSGKEYGPDDAQLDIGRGIPRFYILTLQWRPLVFRSITRHLNVTQCLASVGGHPWWVAVAPHNAPDDADAAPEIDKITAFRVPGNCGIKLHRSAWHAGPFFDQESADFFNLELHDTNRMDHFSCHLDKTFGIEMTFKR